MGKTEVTIRPYRDTDFAALCAIHDAARVGELQLAGLSDAYLTLEETYENEGLFENTVLVAEVDGTVQGFTAYNDEELAWIYVHPQSERRGLGRAMVEEVLRRTSYAPLLIEVLQGNTPALALYQATGFVLQETRSGRLVGNENFPATAHILKYEGAAPR